MFHCILSQSPRRPGHFLIPSPGAFASGLGVALVRKSQDGLEAFLRVSRYDLFLLVVVEVYEVVAIARDADEETAIVVGVGLGVAQRRFVDDVELDVVSAEFEVGADEVLDAFDAFFAGEDGGQEALVEQRTAGFDLIHLAERLDDGGRAVTVCAVARAGAVRLRHSAETSVRRRGELLTEVVVAGGREHIEVVGRPQYAVFAVDVVEEAVVHSSHYVVGVVIVVAEERRLVPQRQTHGLVAFPVVLHRVDEFLERVGTVIVDVLLYRGEAVCDRAYAAALDVVAVVARAAVVVVFAFLDAVADDAGQIGRRHVRRVLVAEVVVDANLRLYSVGHLLLKGRVEVVECLELGELARLDADLFAGEQIDAVGERVLKEFRHVEVAVEQVGFLAAAACFYAAAGAAFARVFE